MALYKYFKKAPSILQNPNGFLSGRMLLEAISSANREMLGLVHQDIGQNCKTINMTRSQYASLCNEKPFFLNLEPILIQVLGFHLLHVLDEVDMLNYGGVSAMPPVPTPTSSYSFREIEFCH